MERKPERHKYNGKISSVRFHVEGETQETHVALFFNDGLLALDAHNQLVNKLGHEFGVIVIENKNGARVKLEFSNGDSLLYTDLISYKKSELDSVVIHSESKKHLYFMYYEKDIPKDIKTELLAFFKKEQTSN